MKWRKIPFLRRIGMAIGILRPKPLPKKDVGVNMEVLRHVRRGE